MENSGQANYISALVLAARAGDVVAYGKLVRATHAMTMAVALDVLRERASAEDAVQEAYLRAYRSLRDLEDANAFPGWLRRVVITVALNHRRAKRVTLLSLDDVPNIPENPVGHMLGQLREVYSEFTEQSLPEIVDVSEMRDITKEAIYVKPSELHHIDPNKILRYDLTLPLLSMATHGSCVAVGGSNTAGASGQDHGVSVSNVLACMGN